MKRKDIVSGLVLIAAGFLITSQAATLTYRDEFGPGPGLLPFWLGIIMSALALCQLIMALRSAGEARSQPESKKHRALLASLGLVGMAAMLSVIGFIASFGLLSFFLVYVVERRSFRSAITVSLAMTLSFAALFRLVLPVSLP